MLMRPGLRASVPCGTISNPPEGSMDLRVSWDEYFMNVARVVATRATCDRKHVGAVLVRDRTILSTGYNGSIRGLPHCTEAGHMMEDGHCVATVHAEAKANIQLVELEVPSAPDVQPADTGHARPVTAPR